MPTSFGELLRKLRRDAGRTLDEVAEVIAVSVVYLSDVERGKRSPFGTERLLKIAHYLEIDPMQLIKAADAERGVIEYDIREARPLAVDVVGGLVASLQRGGLSDHQLRAMKRIMESRNSEGEDE